MTKARLFGIDIDPVGLSEAARVVHVWAKTPGRCRYGVTPNTDHVLLLERSEPLRAAYVDAELIVADGWPVVAAARLLGTRLPGRVPGSDLVPAVFEIASPSDPLRVFFLGAGPGVAERAAQRTEERFPGVRAVGAYGPPFGFEQDAAENEAILARIERANPELLLVGLGAPKQETWVHRHRDRISANAALCIGATIDFLAGEKARAPRWVQRLGLEWFHRMATEPRRLAPRYAANAIGFPKIVLREWLSQRL